MIAPLGATPATRHLAGSLGIGAVQTDSTCPATPRASLIAAIAPMAGAEPVWMVDGSAGLWTGPDTPSKTAWVISRRNAGPLEVEGRRLDGVETLRFKLGLDGPVTDRLVVADPAARSITPEGDPQLIAQYVFVPSYLLYASPGCWELSVRVGEQRRVIVVQQRATAGFGPTGP